MSGRCDAHEWVMQCAYVHEWTMRCARMDDAMCTNGRCDVHEWKRFSDRFVEICTSKRKRDHSCLDAKIQKEKHQKGGN